MIVTETGTVVAVEPKEIIVEVVRTSACNSCKARQGCGQAVLAEWGDSKRQYDKNHFRIPFKGEAEIGARVELGMAHDAVVQVAALVYLLPLVASFLGLILGRQAGFSELIQLVLMALFFGVSLFVMRQMSVAKSSALVPQILQMYPASKDPEVIASTRS